MSKRRRKNIDEIAKYIKDNANLRTLDEDSVIVFFADKFNRAHKTVKEYIKDLERKKIFFRSPKNRLVRLIWPFDEEGLEGRKEWENWKRTEMQDCALS